MKALARFASSVEGRAYARVCRAWGRDPVPPELEAEDDVIAHDFRQALFISMNMPTPEDREDPLQVEARSHEALVKMARLGAAGGTP